MKEKNKKVLFISRSDAFNINNIVEFVSENFDSTICVEERSSDLPSDINDWEGEYIFSYLCPWLLPKTLIKKASNLAINFHPGSPSYPGTGCYNFALYHEAKHYGVTCHHLAPKIDSGDIIRIESFNILRNDTVKSLIDRTYVYLNYLFFNITLDILCNNEVKTSNLKWERKPYRKKDLDNLCKLSKTMDDDEIKKRIRATTFKGKPGPYYVD